MKDEREFTLPDQCWECSSQKIIHNKKEHSMFCTNCGGTFVDE